MRDEADKDFHVTIMASGSHGVLYIGMTSDLAGRVWEHRERVLDGFTKRYNVDRLVYFERHDEAADAARRERAMKRWRRDWKIELIEQVNPTSRDLFGDFVRVGGFEWCGSALTGTYRSRVASLRSAPGNAAFEAMRQVRSGGLGHAGCRQSSAIVPTSCRWASLRILDRGREHRTRRDAARLAFGWQREGARRTLRARREHDGTCPVPLARGPTR